MLGQFFTISSINGVFGKYSQFLTTKMESTHTIHPQYDIMYMLTPNQWTYFPQDILHLPTLKKHQPWPNFSATHHISQCHHVCHICTYIHSISYFLSWFPHLKLLSALYGKIRKFVQYQCSIFSSNSIKNHCKNENKKY